MKNNPKLKSGALTTKKIIIYGATFLLFDLLFSLYVFAFKPQIDQAVQEKIIQVIPPENTSQSNITEYNDPNFPNVTKRSDQININIEKNLKEDKFFVNELNDYLIRTNGIIDYIGDGNKLRVSLNSGEKVNVNYNLNTLLAKAWFGLDENNNLVTTQYKGIPQEELLSLLTTGKKVRIGYVEKDFSLNKEFIVKELVLLN